MLMLVVTTITKIMAVSMCLCVPMNMHMAMLDTLNITAKCKE